ncbi:type VII secretion protein EccB [Streptomonospora nanhaiensis]|uniref:Type VII secretion protein EccB n=1 Tax=Streptomonospora nanhaiensis TaxID=1323731 RepID=A0A853BTC5_9ACTN|nr:type VII secretion protein EccB [Streptomonospora nanhaiensis]MBV2363582.1 type VII secretion protein EccB [Streptomonospora nanhaiensis]MBX9391517.1 type VII secretion protein EccB [Streptomonospora nanhaiensis]NYI98598.1 type VII secretion protein EccB [Streptomonospora nanhaiensis]
MQTRRDRVQAHNFTVGRLGTAMLEGDPDAVDAPMRRTRTGTYIGIALGALICVGFLVFGLIFPGGAANWRQDGNLVVMRETGATYMYGEGALRPVANYTSARLIAGGEPQVSRVSAESIMGERMGAPVGIPGAPDTLPAVDAGATSLWRLCALPPEEDGGEPRTALTVAPDPGVGAPLGDRAALVTGPDGTHHLLWQGRRLRFDEEAGALQALGYGTTPAIAVSQEFLDTVPPAADLSAVEVPGAGEEGPDIAGAPSRVGQVFTVSGGGQGDQHFLLTRDGLVPLGVTDALLLLADPGIRETVFGGGESAAVAVDAGEAGAHLAEDADPPRPQSDGVPAEPPEIAPADEGVPCMVLVDGESSVGLFPADTVDAWAVPELPGVAPGCPTPDLIGIPNGGGGVAAAQPAAGRTGSPVLYLVTDAGAKYRIPDNEVLGALGYEPADTVPVPTALLRLLPTGPDLSPEAAALPVADAAAQEEPATCP